MTLGACRFNTALRWGSTGTGSVGANEKSPGPIYDVRGQLKMSGGAFNKSDRFRLQRVGGGKGKNSRKAALHYKNLSGY